jgi:type II secretory pathway component PulJ
MRTFYSETGITLIEQLLALLLGAVMITSLYGFYRAGLYQFIAQETKIAALQDARGALDIIIRDLKNAGSWGTGQPPAEHGGADDPDGDADAVCNRVYAATPTMIHVQMDLNGNGSCGDTEPRENIRYEITGPTATCPGSKILRRNDDCLLAHVVTPAADKVFRYYDSSGHDLGDTPPLQAIKRIRIAFSVQEKNPDPHNSETLTANLSTSVELRNWR